MGFFEKTTAGKAKRDWGRHFGALSQGAAFGGSAEDAAYAEYTRAHPVAARVQTLSPIVWVAATFISGFIIGRGVGWKECRK
jgi:hypothetical protein